MLIGHTTLDGPAKHAIGKLLVELGDARGPELCLSAAADEECPTYLRVQAAETLLDTPSHEPAVDALLRIARDPLDRDWGSIDLAKMLIRLGYLRDAVDQLCREVTDAVTGPDESYWSTRRTDAIEALDIIAPSERRLLLLHLVDSGAVVDRPSR
jgi:hypothetical protein